MSERQMQLFHEYSETGYRGESERTVTYTLIVGDGNINAIATLEEEIDSKSYGSPREVSVTRYHMGVQKLAALIAKHADRIERPSDSAGA